MVSKVNKTIMKGLNLLFLGLTFLFLVLFLRFLCGFLSLGGFFWLLTFLLLTLLSSNFLIAAFVAWAVS
jgi:hypothetical protein